MVQVVGMGMLAERTCHLTNRDNSLAGPSPHCECREAELVKVGEHFVDGLGLSWQVPTVLLHHLEVRRRRRRVLGLRHLTNDRTNNRVWV